MLNKVWFWMIVGSLFIALGIDFWEWGNNRYRNDLRFPVQFELVDSSLTASQRTFQGRLMYNQSDFNRFYQPSDYVDQDGSISAKITLNQEGTKGVIYFSDRTSLPGLWRSIWDASGKEAVQLVAVVVNESRLSPTQMKFEVQFQPVYFLRMRWVVDRLIEMADVAVKIALGLIGIMAIWLGVMKVAQEAGFIQVIARFVRPIVCLLFPDVPSDHPAVGHMVMNISANVLGLGNAATPFGLKAMEELEKLNPHPGIATNAMVTFLAINTAGFTLIPTQVIAIRAALASNNPTVIIMSSFMAASVATLVGITMAKLFERSRTFRDPSNPPLVPLSKLFLAIIPFFAGLYGSLFLLNWWLGIEVIKTVFNILSIVAIPLLIGSFLIFGYFKKVKVYEVAVEGAKEGFDIAVRIIPYLVAMLVAIGFFRASGGMEILTLILKPITNLIGMPAEVLPMALMRPLSGSGSLGIMTELLKTHGPDSFIGLMASTFYGSTETTFYVLALYFGVASIKNIRHALWTGLFADIAGILTAVAICHALFK